jgi:hypothetical protein
MGAGPSFVLFTASGKWLLEVHDGDVLHGRAVLDVR